VESEIKDEFSWRRLLITLGIVFITAGAVGGSVFFVMNRQIDELNKPIINTTTTILNATTTTKTTTTTIEPVADWTTCSSTKYDFTFKYPSFWTQSSEEFKTRGEKDFEIILNSDIANESYSVTFYNLGSQTSAAFVDGYFSQIETGPSDISNIVVNGNPVVKFYIAKTGISGGGSAHYLFSKDGVGVDISNSKVGFNQAEIMNDSILENIANTFMFSALFLT
jgi:hypothetical protein